LNPTHILCNRPTGPQRGTRVIKPKQANLISQNKIKKAATSQLTGKTEKLLAQKAGHLEVLRGGKKEGRIGGEKKKKEGSK
jgi:hypothetical protein